MSLRDVNIEQTPSSLNPECRLTIVIPVYNRAERVVATLQSVKSQTLRPLNVILVDNNSTDNTLAVLKQWRDSVADDSLDVNVVEEKIAGAAAARNRGLQEVTTPLTMFFDSDDIMASDHCQRAVEAFDCYPEADIIGWDCTLILSTKTREKLRFVDKDVVWNNLFYGTLATQRYVAKTELFKRCGGWNRQCRGWDDIEIGLRLLFLSPKIVKLGGSPTVEVIHSDDSITGQRFADKPQTWETALVLMETTAKDNRRLCRAINFRRALLAGDYRREGAKADSRRLLLEALDKEHSLFYRLLCRVAVAYRGVGLPGISRLLRPFF